MTLAENARANSFVLLEIGSRRFALPAGIVVELAPPVRLHSFPHSSPLIAGVIVRRGHIVPVYDVAPMLVGRSSATHRFYLIARRRIGKAIEFGAIPVNGECELAAGDVEHSSGERPAYVAGTLDVAGESLDVLDLEALLTFDSEATRQPSPAEASS
jgi:chemotaxis signal transduction protein